MTKITYDPEVDALYIELRDLPILKSVDYEEGVTLDFGEDGEPIGLEILDATRHLDSESPWSLLTQTKEDAMANHW